jgi:two-component system, OmpR family, heavy metal sensor histidine kinase CusS
MTTIRRQLTWKLLLAFAAPLVLGGVAVFVTVGDSLREQFDAALHARALAIATVTRQRGDDVDVDTSGRFMREFDAPDADEARRSGEKPAGKSDEHDNGGGLGVFEIWRSDGTPMARSESLRSAHLPFVHVSAPAEEPRFWNTTLPSGMAVRALGFKFVPKRGKDAADPSAPRDLTLVVASDREELDLTLRTLALVLTGCGGVLLAAVSLIVPRVLRRELAPLDALADEAAGITAESLATRFATDRLPGELAPISGRLNDLLARLEQSFERERQFSGDLAHELRTPIAELRSLAELAMRWPATRPADTDRDALAIAVQLEGIVTRLLALLRSERGQLPIERQHVDLGAELTRQWQPFAARAAGRELRVTLDVPAGLGADIDPVLFRSILTNLFENAVEYTPEGGAMRVEARLDCDAHGFIVRVSNDVDDLEPDDLPRLFDRFWRGDPARSGGDHSGLGLSLARAFARALGGDLTATFDGVTTLTLTLTGPLAAE